VSKFGLLRSDGRRERVADICDHIRTIRWLLDAAKGEEWDAINLWLKGFHLVANGERQRLRLSKSRVPIRREFLIGSDKNGRPRIEEAPPTLVEALYLQLLQDATGSKDAKLCRRPGCGEWFYYGPKTGRRSTGEYCSDGCRVKHFIEKKEQSK
jgi:hypothetical protein